MPNWPQAASGVFPILFFLVFLFHFSNRFESLRFVSLRYIAICVDFRNVSCGRCVLCFLFSVFCFQLLRRQKIICNFSFWNASGVAKGGLALAQCGKQTRSVYCGPSSSIRLCVCCPSGYATACNINLLICILAVAYWHYMLYVCISANWRDSLATV